MAYPIDYPETREGWLAFRRSRESWLAEPHGWLSPVALHWLTDTPAAVAGLPGLWWTEAGQARARLAADEALSRGDRTLAGEVTLAPGAPLARTGTLAIEPMVRDGHVLLRIRDSASPLRTGFRGVPVFDFDPDWVVEAEYTPFTAPETVRTGSVVPDLAHEFHGLGLLRFRRGGAEVAMTAVSTPSYPVNIMFCDATSGIETTGTVRQLLAKLPAQGGRAVLDFNRAVNLPCAFTGFCTCPLPPPGNTLPFPVRAGERSAPVRQEEVDT